MTQLSQTIESLRFEILVGFVLCERDLNDFARLKNEAGITVGMSEEEYYLAQLAIDKLEKYHPALYRKFRRELLKKIISVSKTGLLDNLQITAHSDAKNQAALYCNIMRQIEEETQDIPITSHIEQETTIKNILIEYINCSGLEG